MPTEAVSARLRAGRCPGTVHPVGIGRGPRIVVWIYIAFNLLIAAVLVVDPLVIDAPYGGRPMNPTRQFQWFSIATFHLFIIGVTLASLRMRHAVDRRRIHLINAAFYLWDAATQLLYWGDAVGLAPTALYTNTGVSAVVGVVMLAVWRADRPAPAP